jgi:hypothetical protein
MALQAASAHLEVAAGSASGRIWAEDAGHPVRHALVTTCGELKSATCKTVRASTPYPPVLEPGIEEIG